MNKILLILIFILIRFCVSAQKTEFGIIYSPILISKITFDNSYIIFDDYTSLTAGDNKFHGYFTGISTGIFYKYKIKRRFYIQSELNFFGNNFGSQIPDWASSRDKNFTYSSIDIPLMMGYTLNHGKMVKLRIYGGLNNKFGKFITAFYSSFVYLINDNMNQEYYYADKSRKKELIGKLSFYYMNVVGGIGLTKYGTSFDVRFERNITPITNSYEKYNANFSDLFLIRFCVGLTLPNKTAKSFLTTNTKTRR
jgi:hypothetical protein